VSNVKSQDLIAETTNKIQTLRLTRIFKKSGWLVPQKQEIELIGKSQIQISGNSVNKFAYKTKNTIEVKLDDFFLKNNESLIVNTYDYEIREVYSYEKRGRLFAYEISYVPFTINDKGIKTAALAKTKRYYFDEDGDGTFESLYQSQTLPENIPAWVK
jgi:hypothetical protein